MCDYLSKNEIIFLVALSVNVDVTHTMAVTSAGSVKGPICLQDFLIL